VSSTFGSWTSPWELGAGWEELKGIVRGVMGDQREKVGERAGKHRRWTAVIAEGARAELEEGKAGFGRGAMEIGAGGLFACEMNH
jgi:hypothetical protein